MWHCVSFLPALSLQDQLPSPSLKWHHALRAQVFLFCIAYGVYPIPHVVVENMGGIFQHVLFSQNFSGLTICQISPLPVSFYLFPFSSPSNNPAT